MFARSTLILFGEFNTTFTEPAAFAKLDELRVVQLCSTKLKLYTFMFFKALLLFLQFLI